MAEIYPTMVKRYEIFLYIHKNSKQTVSTEMNIVILSRNPSLYSTQSLARAARRKHHFVRIIDYVNCDLIIDDGKLSVYYHGRKLDNIDAIIPRIGASWTSYGAAIIRQFEYTNVFTTLSSEALVKARNKLICSQILAAQGMHLPKTIVSNNSYAYSSLLNHFNGEKVVIKLINSTHGVGVLLANKGIQAENILEAFTRSKQKSMIQEYICLLYTSPSPRDGATSRMPSSA